MGGVVDGAGAGRERGVGPFYEGCLKQKEGEWETTKDEWCVTILGELLELSCKNRGRRKDIVAFCDDVIACRGTSNSEITSRLARDARRRHMNTLEIKICELL